MTMEITTGISNKTGYGNVLVLVKSRLQVVHRLIQRACPFLTFRYLSVTYFDFGDRVTSYRRTGQFLRTNLVFVSSTIKRCIVPELALSTTAGTARTPGCMPTYDKDYPQLVSPIYEWRTSGHSSGLWWEHSEIVNGKMLFWECWVLGLLARFWP